MSEAEKERSCALVFGRLDESLDDWLNARWRQAGAEPPLLVACEPANSRTRAPDYCGLFVPQKDATWSFSSPLIEVRFYYTGGMLRALADGGSTRWAAWWEELAVSPKWIPDGPNRPKPTTMARRQRRILLHDAANRRGLAGAAFGKANLLAFEYYEQAALRWWRLEIDAQR